MAHHEGHEEGAEIRSALLSYSTAITVALEECGGVSKCLTSKHLLAHIEEMPAVRGVTLRANWKQRVLRNLYTRPCFKRVSPRHGRHRWCGDYHFAVAAPNRCRSA
jgi:hypothetical protein